MSDLEEHNPRHSCTPFGNPAFLEMLRRSAVAAEHAIPKPEEHDEQVVPIPKDDLRAREIAALKADVAALRCTVARLETIVANFTRELE
jgi:hypothetical protein